MGAENYWKHYQNVKIPVKGLSVSPLPVRLADWDKFAPIGGMYLNVCEDLLRKRLKLDESITLLDYIGMCLINDSEDLTSDDPEKNKIIEFSNMLSYAFRLPVEGMVEKKNGELRLVFRINGNNKDLITRENYAEVRELIMEQNLFYDPIIAPNAKSQELIDKAIARMAKSSSDIETNIESMLVLVSRHRDINSDDYTYYKLRADYEMELRLEQSRAIPTYRAVGADIPPIELGEVLGMHTNPYSKDKLFKRNDRSKDASTMSAK